MSKDYVVGDVGRNVSGRARQWYIGVGDSSLPYVDVQRSIGGARVRVWAYPNVWLLDQQARPLMQMPAGTGTFETVAEQLDILRLQP